MKNSNFCATCPPEIKTWEHLFSVKLKSGYPVWMCPNCKKEREAKRRLVLMRVIFRRIDPHALTFLSTLSDSDLDCKEVSCGKLIAAGYIETAATVAAMSQNEHEDFIVNTVDDRKPN